MKPNIDQYIAGQLDLEHLDDKAIKINVRLVREHTR